MEFVDDRTDNERRTHTQIVLMTDRFLSGWGRAKGGPSYAGWAFKDGQLSEVLGIVAARTDSMRVRVVNGDYRPPAGPGHCHIYVYKRREPIAPETWAVQGEKRGG